jgi:hypothetical protein
MSGILDEVRDGLHDVPEKSNGNPGPGEKKRRRGYEIEYQTRSIFRGAGPCNM